jgi:DNA mismatch endonuclease (patch repair protein)
MKGVPGRPDVAFPLRRKAVFVHGCFWHAHEACPAFKVPKTRTDFWVAKFRRNKERDARLLAAAEADGWRCLVIWECETRDQASLAARLRKHLGPMRQKRSRLRNVRAKNL